jgi:hypothetical protein
MSKSAFVARVSRWAEVRGVSFSEARLNEWIKQKLVSPAERQFNRGQRPTYAYGCAHYRRTLQVLRLTRDGMRDVDALRTQLFLRGYDGVTPQLRRSIRNEFRRARASLNPTMRSTHLDRLGPIPEGPQQSILRNLGQPDRELVTAGYVSPPEQLIALVRASRTPGDVGSEELGLHPAFREALPLLRGLMAPSDEGDTQIERLIRRACNEELLLARAQFWRDRCKVRREGRALSENAQRDALRKVDRSWLLREIAATNFVVRLRKVRQNHSAM